MQFKFTNADGQTEHINLERWVWVAIYNDGSYLMQFDNETNEFHQIKEIDFSKLDTFVMQHHTDQSKRYEIHWKPHFELIHFYRNYRNDDMPQNEWVRTYNFGFKYKDKTGMVQKFILEIMPTDIVAITDNDGRAD